MATLSAQTNPICGPSDSTTYCQYFDNSGTSMLSGSYFVREVRFTTCGTSVTSTYGLMGTMTFTPTTDTTGASSGTYTFTGQEVQVIGGTTTGPATYPTSGTVAGTYRVSANGAVWIQDLVAISDWLVGAVGGAGPNAFIASEPNSLPSSGSNNITIMVGIPVGGTALSGNYYGSYFDFHGANVSSIRDALFPFTANNGNLGTLTVTGAGTDLGMPFRRKRCRT